MQRRDLKPAEISRLRDEWLDSIQALKQQVQGWAEHQGWRVTESERLIVEEQLGTYSAPVLEITTPAGEVWLEPQGHDLLAGGGRVDLYAYPTMYRVMLLSNRAPQWTVRVGSGLKWPHPWGEATFVELAQGLVDAE